MTDSSSALAVAEKRGPEGDEAHRGDDVGGPGLDQGESAPSRQGADRGQPGRSPHQGPGEGEA
eukprot:6483687-Pyramimonas_sp.AAC.1